MADYYLGRGFYCIKTKIALFIFILFVVKMR